MRAQSIWAAGFLSMMIASGVVKANDGFAFEAQRTDLFERIGAGGAIHTQSQSVLVRSGEAVAPGTKQWKVDVITRIGAGGSTYSSSRPG
ncbi:MAG: hypothetical protein CV089_11245 [Nitrospira sp. WS110]|nr:hypothetical protein [Nitrospira sp. WS110]